MQVDNSRTVDPLIAKCKLQIANCKLNDPTTQRPNNPTTQQPIRGEVQFDNVRFGYDKSNPVLKGRDEAFKLWNDVFPGKYAPIGVQANKIYKIPGKGVHWGK